MSAKTRRLYNSLSHSDLNFFINMHKVTDLSRLDIAKNHIQHGHTSVFMHSVAVAYYSYRLAKALRLSFHEKELIRGALLHDYFLYDWHISDSAHKLHGFRHPATALKNAEQDFNLKPLERDIIRKHMFPLTLHLPKYRESILVCLIDKGCSLYETLKLGHYKALRHRMFCALEDKAFIKAGIL